MGDFDKILKENIEQMLLAVAAKYMGIHIKKINKLKEKIQLTEREVDFLAKITDRDGKVFLLHIEFQTKNDPQMLRRIEEYHGFLRGRYHLPIEHFVIYLGRNKATMKTNLSPHLVFKGFHLINLSEIDPDAMIESNTPEEVLLAILGQYRKEKSQEIVKRILTRLQALSSDEKELKKYVKHLTVLARLRNFEHETIKIFDAMPITYDVEKDALYIMGEQKGEARGEARGEAKGEAKGEERGLKKGIEQGEDRKETAFIISLLTNCPDWSNKKIALVVGTSIKKVAAIKKANTPQKIPPTKHL